MLNGFFGVSESKYMKCISDLPQICLKIQIYTGKRQNISELTASCSVGQ